jgi:hypothetical protein
VAVTILLGIATISNLYGQTQNDVPKIVNCFQELPLTPGATYNMLRSDFQKIIVGNGTPSYLQIDAFQSDGSYYYPFNEIRSGYFGLSGNGFKDYFLPVLPDEDSVVHVVELSKLNGTSGGLSTNSNQLIINSGISFLDLYTFYPIQGSNTYTRTGPTRINFINPEDAFDINPITDENNCVTFDNFKTNFTSNLPGFCGGLGFRIEALPGDMGPYLKQSTDIYKADNNLPIANLGFDSYCSEACDNMGVPQGSAKTKCGCKYYNMVIEIHPCEGNEDNPDCDPIMINKQIEICCTCDLSKWNNGANN